MINYEKEKSIWDDKDKIEKVGGDSASFLNTPTTQKRTPDQTYKNVETEGVLRESQNLDLASDLSEGDLEWALRTTKGIHPDKVAATRKLVEATKLPKGTVQRNFITAEEYADAKSVIDILRSTDEEGKLKYPRTYRWLTDPDNMALAKDDVKTLSEMEDLITVYRKPFKRAGRVLLDSTKDITTNILESASYAYDTLAKQAGADTKDLITNPLFTSAITSPAMLLMRMAGDANNDKVVESLKSLANSEILDFNELPRTEGLGQFGYDMLGMATQIGGASIFNIAAPGVGPALFMGSHIFGGTKRNLEAQGVEESTAAKAAMFNAVTQAPLEAFAFGKLFKLFGAKAGKQVVTEYLGALSTEFVTETLQSFPENIAQIWGTAQKDGRSFTDSLKMFFENIPETFKQGMYEGLVAAGASAITGLGAIPKMYKRAQKLNQDKQFFDGLEDKASMSKLKERYPDQFKDFMDKTIEVSDAPKDVYIPAKVINKYFQDDPKGLGKFLSDLGITEGAVKDAMETGADLKVPISSWMSNYAGTDLSVSLKDFMKFSADGMSVNEQKFMQQELSKRVQEMQKEYDAMVEEESLPEKLLAMREKMILPKEQGGWGVSAEEADTNLSIWKARAKIAAGLWKTTVVGWLDNVINPSLQVGGEFTGKVDSVIYNQETGDIEQNENFKNWFGESKVTDQEGKPLVVYHGTTHEFNEFSDDKANIENDFGAGFYFTNTLDDVESNYAGEGPDLTSRIEQRAERIESEEGISIEEARVKARNELKGSTEKTLETYLSFKNPFVLGGDNETELTLEYKPNEDDMVGFRDEAWEEIKGDNEDLTDDDREDYENEIEDKARDIYDANSYELEESGNMLDLIEGLKESATYFDDVDIDAAISEVLDNLGSEYVTAEAFIKNLRESESLMSATDDNGNLASNELIRQGLEFAGYDGIIDNTVNKKFGSERRTGKSMAGMYEDTVHYIAFKPNSIKSVNNKGTFSTTDPNIYLQEDPRIKKLKPGKMADKAGLKEMGFGTEAMGFGGTAEVSSIDGEPAVAMSWLDGALAGFSVSKKFRGTGLGQSVIKDLLRQGPFKIVDPNEQMLSMVKKVANVSEVDKGTGTITVTEKQNTFLQEVSPSQFYSGLIKTVEEFKQEKGSAQQFLNQIKKQQGVKPEEIEWTGLEEWLGKRKSVTKQEVLDFLNEAQVQIIEVDKNSEGRIDPDSVEWEEQDIEDYGYEEGGTGSTKWSEHQMEGEKENYRELLLTLDKSLKLPKGYEVKEYNGSYTVEDKNGDNVVGYFDTREEAINNYLDKNGIDREEDFRYTVHFNEANILLHLRMNDRFYTESNPDFVDPETLNLNFDDAFELVDKGDYYQVKNKATGVEYVASYNKNNFPDIEKLKNDLMKTELKKAHPDYKVAKDKPKNRQKKVLFIEEIQSDWHQQGREKGYIGQLSKEDKAKIKEYDVRIKDNSTEIDIVAKKRQELFSKMEGLEETSKEWKDLNEKDKVLGSKMDELLKTKWVLEDGITSLKTKGVPNAPFKESWKKLAVKKILQIAADGGYDTVAWTPGEVQVERWKGALRKAVDKIEWEKTKKGVQLIGYKNGSKVVDTTEKENALSDAIGKVMSEQILKDSNQTGEIVGEDITIDDTGMAGFYDRIIPSAFKEILKKLDKSVKVGTTNIEDAGKYQHGLLPGAEFIEVTDLDSPTGKKKFLKFFGDVYELDENNDNNVKRYPLEIGAEVWEVAFDREYVSTKAIEPVRKEAIIKSLKEGEIYQGDKGQEVWQIPVTEKMVSEIQKGLPLFQAQKNNVRGSVQFTDNETLLSLFNSANRSTFLHETGHVFIEDLRRLVSSGKADEQTKKDFNTLIDFAGGKFNRKGIEKMARAFEAYLMEGKAPSVSLANAFRRFRDWLMNIYKTVRGLDVEINNEVREVFDRMLASEKEIEESKEYYNMKQNITDLLPKTKGATAKVKKTKEQSDQEALDKNIKKYMKAYMDALGGKERLMDQATKEIDALEVNKVIAEAIDRGGFDPDEIEDLYGKEVLKILKKNHKGLVYKSRKPKKVTYYKTVLDAGGIDPSTLGPEERKRFKENGLFGLFRKDGRSLDDVAQSLALDNTLKVPSDYNPGDYLYELLLSKEVVDTTTDFDPEEFVRDAEAITPEELALNYDYETADTMINEISQAPNRNKAISDRFQELFKQAESDIRKDLSGSVMLGDNATHTDASLAYLIAQGEILSNAIAKKNKTKPERIEAKAFKDAAEEAISNRKVSSATRYDIYAKAEQKYARETLQAIEKGDYETAAEANRKRILNHAMVQAAIKARDSKTKIEARIKRVLKSKPGTIISDYLGTIIQIASNFNLTDKVPSRPDKLDVDGVIERLESGDFPLMVPDFIKEPGKDYRDLKFYELEQLDNFLVAVSIRGRNVVKFSEEEKEKTVYKKAAELSEPMLNRKGVKPLNKQKRLYSIKSGIRFLLAEIMHIQFDLKAADGYVSFGKKGKPGGNEEMFGAIFKKQKDLIKASSDFDNTYMKPLVKGIRAINDRLSKAGKFFDIPGVAVPAILSKNGTPKWTGEMVIAFALNTGTSNNLNTLMNGFNMNIDDVHKVLGLLTSEELATIQNIWNSLDTLFPGLDEAFYRMNGYRLDRKSAVPIEVISADGKTVKLKGGYYPTKHDADLSRTVGAYTEKDILKDENLATFHRNKPRDGMTKEAIEKGTAHPILLNIMPLYQHIQSTLRFTHLSEVLTDVHKIVKNNDWADAYTDLMGKDKYENLTPWLSHIARPEPMTSDKFDKLTSRYQKIASIGALGMNIMSMVKQPLSLTSAAQEIGWKNVAVGLAQVARHPIDSVNMVNKFSEFMKQRAGKVELEISKQLDQIKPFTNTVVIGGKELTLKDIKDMALVNIKMGDILGAYPAWLGTYNKTMEETNGDHDKSVSEADRIVSETQPVTSGMFKNLWQIGGKRSSGASRFLKWMIAPFTGWTMKYGARSQTYYRGWREGKIKTKDFAAHVVNERLLPPIAVAVLTAGLREDEIDDWSNYIWSILGYWASYVPGLNILTRGLQYGTRNGVLEVPGAAKTVKNIVKIGEQGYKIAQGEGDYVDLILALGETVEYELGIPAIKAAKDIKRTADAIIGD